jgi:hypothetical protein
MNIAVDSGVLKFGSLNDAGNAFVQNNIMTMDLGTGNVGIGTDSPDDMLDVENGNIRLRSNSDGNTGLFRMFDTAGIESGQIYPASGDLKIYSPNDVLFTQSGNVGIGTTNPSDGKLQVFGNSSSDWGGYFYNQNAGGIGLHVETNSYGTEQLLRLSSLTGSGGSNIVRMVVRADGKVGIGTDSPSEALTVTGGICQNTGQPTASNGQFVHFNTGSRTVSSSTTSTVTLLTRSPNAEVSSTGTCYLAGENSGGSIQFGVIIDFFYSNGTLQTTARETGSSQGTVSVSIAESGNDLAISVTYAGGLGGAIRYTAAGHAVNASY